MRFSIKQTGRGSERIGCLSGFMSSPNAVIETPTSGLLTQSGSVVHMTAEVLAKVFSSPQLLWVPLSRSIHLEPGLKAQGEGVAKFVGLPDQVVCVTLHNVSQEVQPGHFELDRVPLWTKNGKKMITGERYMDLMEIFKPDMLLAIADSCIPLDEGCKRVSKAVERTKRLLDICVKKQKESKQLQETALIGVIVGASHQKKLERCLEHVLTHKDDIKGVALAGLTDGSPSSTDAASGKINNILKNLNDMIPSDLLRIVEGCWNPAIIVSAIELGWDVFDGSYPLKLTNAGLALALNFDVNQCRYSGEMCILDMKDFRYKEDFTPLLEGCECLACKKHTRAYIQHLLNTREMLASVLLSIHNLYHFNQLFEHARRHIVSRTFQDFKLLITKQYEDYKASIPEDVQTENENTKESSQKKARLGATEKLKKMKSSYIPKSSQRRI